MREHAGDAEENFREPVEGEASFAPAKAAAARFGVEYKGPYETIADGTNRAVRLHARALASAGLPVRLTSFSHTMVSSTGVRVHVQQDAQYERVLAEVGPLVHASIESMPIRVRHAVVRDAAQVQALAIPKSATQDPNLIELVDRLFRGTILYSVWERTEIDKPLARMMNRMGECWVPCRQNAEMLRSCGVERVVVVPHPVDPASPLLGLDSDLVRPWGTEPGFDGLKLAGRRFYSIGAWQPRKAYHELLGAFLRLFRPGDDVTLVLKTGDYRIPGYPTLDESVRHWLEDAVVRGNGWRAETLMQSVAIVLKYLSDEQVVDLHRRNNIYVSSSRGEAWNLGAFDAKCAGNRLVHVPFGGTADFADPDVDVEVPFRLGPVHSFYKWQGEWADFNHFDLSGALALFEYQPRVFRQRDFLERFGMPAVGALMRERVLERARDVAPAAYQEWRKE
jgi:glycosyltransferase involved in cell wall biosynthesis